MFHCVALPQSKENTRWGLWAQQTLTNRSLNWIRTLETKQPWATGQDWQINNWSRSCKETVHRLWRRVASKHKRVPKSNEWRRSRPAKEQSLESGNLGASAKRKERAAESFSC